jgi:hypothetical protein
MQRPRMVLFLAAAALVLTALSVSSSSGSVRLSERTTVVREPPEEKNFASEEEKRLTTGVGTAAAVMAAVSPAPKAPPLLPPPPKEPEKPWRVEGKLRISPAGEILLRDRRLRDAAAIAATRAQQTPPDDAILRGQNLREVLDIANASSPRGNTSSGIHVPGMMFANLSPFAPYRSVAGGLKATALPEALFSATGTVVNANSSRESGRSSSAESLRLRVSRLHCVGGVAQEMFSPTPAIGPRDWARTTCVFRDLVWLPKPDEHWLFVRDPRRTPSWDFPSESHGDPKKFPLKDPPSAQLRLLLARDIRFLDVEIPPGGGDVGVVTSAALEKFPRVAALGRAPEEFWHVLLNHQTPTSMICSVKYGLNIGHFLADFIWPAYSMMRNGGALALDNQLLYVSGRVVGDQVGVGECPLIGSAPMQKFLPTLSRRQAQRLLDFDRPVQLPMLVAGDAQRYLYEKPFAEPYSALQYRSFVHAVLGEDGSPSDKAPLVLIRVKKHRHRIVNDGELLKHLRSRYPRARVFLYDPAEVGDLEVRLMARVNVLITPAGGGSFGAGFLPQRAAAIFLDACWPCQMQQGQPTRSGFLDEYNPINGTDICCTKIESFLWGEMPFLSLYYTHRDPSTLMFDATAPLGWFPYLDYSYSVDLAQIDALVDEALDRTGFSDMVPSAT